MTTGQFTGIHIDGFNDDKRTVISCADTKEGAMKIAIHRTLAVCELHGSIAVVEQSGLSPEQFADLSSVVNKFFAEKGIE